MACPRVGEQTRVSLLARSPRAHSISSFSKRPIGHDWPPIWRRRFPCGRERRCVPCRAISQCDAQNPCSPRSHLAGSSTSTPRGIGLMPRAGNEGLRERIPDGWKRREPPLERRFRAYIVSHLNSPSRFRNLRSFKVSKPRRQYAQGCVEERAPIAPCQQRCGTHPRVLQCGHQR